MNEACPNSNIQALFSKDHLIKRAVYLSWFTIIYNLIEGIISIGYGIEDESIALFGFGADSFIETFSAVLVLWRFSGETGLSEKFSLQKEKGSTLGIGILFLILAICTASASIFQLVQAMHPETTLPGIIISSLSLSFMVFLWKAKKNIGKTLNSSTVLKDADCSLACIKLSIILFLGSILYYFFSSLWWIDSLAALILSFFIGKEGRDTLKAVNDPSFSGGCGCSQKN